MSDARLGFIGVVMDDRGQAAAVNGVLSQHAELIRARVGVPDPDRDAGVIGLIVHGNDRALGALTARLGNIQGVQVKSALSKQQGT